MERLYSKAHFLSQIISLLRLLFLEKQILSLALVLVIVDRSASAEVNPGDSDIHSSAISADHSENYTYDGVDITELVHWIEGSVYTVQTPFSIYHWNRFGTTVGDGPEALATAQTSSEIFWRKFGTSSNSMYGNGLYFAIDPFSTNMFGGVPITTIKPPKWDYQLLRLEVPVGFKIITTNYLIMTGDLRIRVGIKNRQKIWETLTQFECPETALDSDDLVSKIFSGGGSLLSQKCQRLVKRIVRNIIKPDALAYGYGFQPLDFCTSQRGIYGFALVLMQSRHVNSETLAIFTQSTVGNIEERRQIQTLFHYISSASFENSVGPLSDIERYNLAKYLQSHPNLHFIQSRNECYTKSCLVIAQFCSDSTPQTCEDYNIAIRPAIKSLGDLITSAEVEATSVGAAPGALLWPNLEGTPKSKDFKDYFKKQLVGCFKEAPFVQIKSSHSTVGRNP